MALAFVFLVWGGAEIYVAARLLAQPLGVSLRLAIVGISLVVGIYATAGGFRAVVATAMAIMVGMSWATSVPRPSIALMTTAPA